MLPVNSSRRSRLTVASLMLLFLVRGVFYCFALPMWEGFDEPYQFAAVQYAALTGHAATPATPVSRQVAASIYLSPAPWMLRLHQLPKPVLTQEQYWALPSEEREQLRRELLSLPQSWAGEASNPAIQNYEGQQAPLFYLVSAPVFRAVSNLSLPGQVLAMRLFWLLLASAAVPLGYWLLRRTLGNERLALLATALVVALPELLINLGRVSNESLALLLCTVLLLLSIAFVQAERPLYYVPAIAAAMGLALLTKAYFLAFLPAVVLLLWLKLRPPRQSMRFLAALVMALVISGAIAGPWYWHIHRASGSWSGQGDDVATRHLPRLTLLAQVVHVNWRSGFASILLSHVWFGGWSFLRFPAWIYLCMLFPAAIAVLGMCIYVVKWFRSGSPPDAVVAIASFYVCFWIGLCYHVLVTYVHTGVSASTGWYLYCLVFGEIALLVAGLAQLFRPGALRWLIPVGVALCALIDLYGVHAYMLPYYTGLISHVGERVRPLSLGDFSPSEVFSRLATLGPAGLRPGMLELAWGAYLLATVGVAGLAWAIARKADSGN
jgi:Dolichyl-phosphate-mannose-protein mannosyltransferase